MFDAIRVRKACIRSWVCRLFLVSLFLAIPEVTRAQSQSTADGTSPLGSAPGSPAGSYALSGFDNVNLYNGNVNFNVPLVHIGGRGSAGYTMMVPFNSKHWQVTHTPPNNGTPDMWVPAQNWWVPIPPGYGPGVLYARTSGDLLNAPQPSQCLPSYLAHALTRLTFVEPDGTEHELVDTQTGGQRLAVGFGQLCTPVPQSRGSVFTTAEGPSMTFIAEDAQNNWTPVTDAPTVATFGVSGVLFFPDGTRYRIDGGQVSWIKDRNGNMTSFAYTGALVTQITDPLGRLINITYADFTSSTPHDIIRFNGFNGQPRTIQVFYSTMHTVFRDQGLSALTVAQLFPNLNGGQGTYDPTVVSSVELPNQQSYTFKYNQWGEIGQVVLPTGGAVEYDYTTISATVGDIQVFRPLAARRTYPNGPGTAFEGRTTYQYTLSPSYPPGSTATRVSHYDSSSALLAGENHSFSGNANSVPTGDFPALLDGKELQIDQYDTNGTTILRTTTNIWQQNPVNWWPVTPVPSIGVLVETDTTLKDTTPNLMSKEVYVYDKYNNRTDVTSYDFGQNQSGGKLRHSQTAYLTANTIGQTTYHYDSSTITNGVNPIYLRSLPASQKIFDSGDVLRSETDFEYDNYTLGLTLRSSVAGHDSAFDNNYLTRGNPTHVVSGFSLDNASDARSQYDTLGNVIQKTVLRTGNTYDTAMVDYDSAFQFAYPTKFTSPIPDPSGVNGQITALVTLTGYDLSTGLVTSVTDPNGNATLADYADPLDRIMSASRPDGGRTTFSYVDTPGSLSEQTAKSIDSTQSEVTTRLFDGLGRMTESQTSVPDSGAYVTVKRTYDGMGRLAQQTNPYKPLATGPTETALYTTTAYDALSRVRNVTDTDGSVAHTDYANNQILVTDQAGKQQISQSDGLGRLTDVWEITPSDSWTVGITFPNHLEVSAGYHTAYSYDALGDLIMVQQSAQQRRFTYDSLKRLRSAQNPENGTIAYTYQNNGSLSQKTDARATTTYSYDAVGRLGTRSYSDTTPTVSMKYDGAGITPAVTNAKGRLTSTVSSVSETDILAYDVMGRATKSQQITNTGSSAYGTLTFPAMSYSYNLAGMMTDETYPSGKTVHTDYDSAARIAGVKNSGAGGGYYAGSFASDGANRIAYASHGGVARMKLGNGLWDQINYNNRLQPQEIGLGPNGSASLGSTIDGSKMDLVYDYGAANNGNVMEQKISVGGSLIADQKYRYDYLNRLIQATETYPGNPNPIQSWARTFNYDQFGNMWVTNPQGIGVTQATPQAIDNYSAATNQLKSPAVYDLAGNQTTDLLGANTCFYDAENRITNFDNGAGVYAYDGRSQRVAKTTSAGTSVFVYDAEGRLVAEYGGPTSASNGGTSYLTTDHLGSTRLATNAFGSVIARHDYLPFGEEIASNIGARAPGLGYGASDDTRQKFTLKERDAESGLDYFGARYFSSVQARFTGCDPDNYQARRTPNDPQSWNAYSYVGGNPLARVDPDGRDWFEKFKNLLKGNGWKTNDQVDAQRKKQQEEDLAYLKGLEATGPLIAYDPVSNSYFLIKADELRGEGITRYANYFRKGYTHISQEEADRLLNGGVQIAAQVIDLGNKLNYIFGKATGDPHNVQRSTDMLRSLEKIGLPDTPANRQYIAEHLADVASKPGINQGNGRVLRESLLMGPQGAVKVQSIWEDTKLITVMIFGSK
jgi:RHS repeat-associated protein